jgi:hypothetical protein
MKKFDVSVDITMSKSIEVEAENETEAMAKVSEMIDNNPYNYTNGFSHYVGHQTICADEIEEK